MGYNCAIFWRGYAFEVYDDNGTDAATGLALGPMGVPPITAFALVWNVFVGTDGGTCPFEMELHIFDGARKLVRKEPPR